ncbi:microtubule-actin cross-linking factor 1-like isoform X24 [Gallus gallus]|uniref:microtubule-actin cross-linking factor 1-like isoform X24 n=1 Tax=Gallus gallus TaxID=9031 RepID=UPI001AE20A9F|nr:microtubule-actin cross-linking factor 1-like isoform X24 [Gallus gallus]
MAREGGAEPSMGLSGSEENVWGAVLRAAEGRKDERDRVQKKTFTKWVNKHLLKAQRHIQDLYEDLRDGHNLISLLEVLSGDTLVGAPLRPLCPIANSLCPTATPLCPTATPVHPLATPLPHCDPSAP